MSKRHFLRKSALSVAAGLGLGALASDVSAQIVIPPDFTIGVQTITPGLLEGRVAGAFNTTAANPGQVGAVGGIKLEPIMAQTPGGNNVEPWPDNVTYIYSGQMFFPDNTGTGTSTFAMAEHVDDSTLIRIDGIQRLSNQQWDVPNTTGVLNLPAGWHDIELRFGQGGGGAGPSNSGGWTDALGFGVDFTLPIDGAQPPTQANFTRPVDPGNASVFRVFSYNTDTSRDGQSVTVNANGKLTVHQERRVPLGPLTVGNGVTFTVDSPAATTTFSESNLGATSTFAIASGTVSTGPLKSGGAVTSITKTGAGRLAVPTNVGSNVASTTVNVNEGTLAVAIGASGAAVGTGPINVNGATLALTNDLVTPNRGGTFATTGEFFRNDPFNPTVNPIPDSANGFGWIGLDSKTNLDTRLSTLTPIASRDVNLEINFPRGDGNLVNGAGNDDPNDIFNTGGANLGVALTGNEEFITRFTGKLNVTSAGATEFLMMSNDGAVMFLDMDTGPGTNWQKVVDNNRHNSAGGGAFQGHYSGASQGVTNETLAVDAAAPSIPNPAAPNLAVGVYDYIVGFYNTGGAPEAGIELYWTPAGGTRSIIPHAITTSPVTLANTVNISGNSSLNVEAPSATMTDLRMAPGSSLRVSGNALTTNITATGAGTVLIGSAGQPVSLTTLSDGGNAVRFAANQGRVLLTRTGGPGAGFGATSSVGTNTGGTLVATGDTTANTLNGAPVTLQGGTLELISNPGITKSHVGDAGFTGTFLEDTIDPGTTPTSNYIVFRGLTANDFSLASIPLIGGTARAPINAIELVRAGTSIPIKFAADQPDGAGGDDANSQVTGAAGVLNTSVWNNFDGPNQATPQALNLVSGGVGSPSGATVTWSSAGTWSSTGRGEENNTAPAGENRDLMAGYLDTGALGGVGVTINVTGVPASLTSGTGYDLYVYIKGGVNGRGGDYRFGSSTVPAPNFGSNVTVTENSAINVTGFTGAQVNNISVDAGRTLTVNGNALEVNDISGAGTVRFNTTRTSEVAGALGGTATVQVAPSRTVDFTKNGAAATGTPTIDVALGATANFTPGAGGTYAASAVATITNDGLVHAANGVTDLSGATMTTPTVALPGLQAGLFGGRVAGGTNATAFPNPNDALSGVDLTLSRAQTTDNNFFGGDNGTWVYTGEIKIPDTDGDGTPGPIAFGEQFDDFVLLKIDGQELINNNAWNVPHSSGEFERADNEPDTNGTPNDGWYSIEARFGQGGGGVGPNTGWTIGFGIDTTAGFDLKTDPATGTPPATAANYTAPVDDGTMNLFRAVSPGRENIRVDAGATLKLGAMINPNIVNVNGRLELHGATSKMNGSTLNIAGTPTAPTATLDLTDSALVLDYPATGPTSAEVGDVRSRIIAGRGGSGLNKTWNGQGITSSTAGAAPVNSMSVGYAVNGTLPLGPYSEFRGQTVDTSSILMRFTRTADANLDGVVNNDDVAVVGANYAPGSPKPRWDLGDFDYNGFVDNDDITLLGAFYNPSAPPIPAPAAGVAAVPEPASWLMLTIGGLGAGLAGWRRRRGKK